MDMRKNEKGSSLIFALAVISIITMVIAACMAISYSYYNRSIVANSERQAYLTAKSVATYVVNDILSGSEDFVPTEDNKVISLNVSDLPSDMGSISTTSSNVVWSSEKIDVETGETIEKKDVDKITVSVTAVYGNKSKTVNADLMQYKGENKNWQLREYYESKPEAKSENNISMAEDAYTKVKDLFAQLETGGQAAAMEYINKTVTSIPGYTLPLTNKSHIKNDFLQKYYYYELCGGEFPMLNNDELNMPKSMKEDAAGNPINYYVHVMFGIGTNNFYKLVYATPTNDVTNHSNWKPSLVYVNGHWYYAENKWNTLQFPPISGLDQGTDTDKEKAYQAVLDKCTEANLAQ